MGLEEKNLDTLSTNGGFTLQSGRPEQCLKQMLSALDFLDYKRIVHRDVKPDNILCSRPSQGPGYHFRLTDFGVGKLAKYAYSCQGTQWYMAPEILRLRTFSNSEGKIREQQTPKVDVWSLFVTIAWARNVCNYRSRDLNNNDEVLGAVKEACSEVWMSRYKAMAIEDPIQRASALDVLIQHFDGRGATERNGNDFEMTDGDDDLFRDPQPVETAQHSQLPVHLRPSPRVHDPYRINKKRTWPSRTHDRWTALANGLQ